MNADSELSWERWTRVKLTKDRLWALEQTQHPFTPPYPIEQREFMELLKTFILPPLPL